MCVSSLSSAGGLLCSIAAVGSTGWGAGAPPSFFPSGRCRGRAWSGAPGGAGRALVVAWWSEMGGEEKNGVVVASRRAVW